MITLRDGTGDGYELSGDISSSKTYYTLALYVEDVSRTHEVWLTKEAARQLALDILKHVKLERRPQACENPGKIECFCDPCSKARESLEELFK